MTSTKFYDAIPDDKAWVELGGHLQEIGELKQAERDEIAASLGISRLTVNTMLEEPPLRVGGRQPEARSGEHMRHAHGVGRRRHAGAGVRS